MKSTATEVELIEFKEPNEAQLYISRIKWPSDNDKYSLVKLLEDRFLPFGFLNSIKTDLADSGDWYAYINYYSSKAAEKALKTFGTNNLVINGQSCRLVRKNRDLTSNGRPLSLHQCEKLANFYLGFNGWTSQILYHQLEAEEKTQGQQGQGGGNKTYATAIKLKFPNFNLNVEGVGIAEAEFLNLTEKLHQIAMAQKFSRSAAMVNAFSKVILVLVHNSYKNDGGLHFVTEPGPKLTVRINTTKNDPFHYNPLWDDKPMIDQVNQLSASPDFED